jgi:hypothetical protein
LVIAAHHRLLQVAITKIPIHLIQLNDHNSGCV